MPLISLHLTPHRFSGEKRPVFWESEACSAANCREATFTISVPQNVSLSPSLRGHFLARGAEPEESHTNWVHCQGRSLLIVVHRPPSRWPLRGCPVFRKEETPKAARAQSSAHSMELEAESVGARSKHGRRHHIVRAFSTIVSSTQVTKLFPTNLGTSWNGFTLF